MTEIGGYTRINPIFGNEDTAEALDSLRFTGSINGIDFVKTELGLGYLAATAPMPDSRVRGDYAAVGWPGHATKVRRSEQFDMVRVNGYYDRPKHSPESAVRTLTSIILRSSIDPEVLVRSTEATEEARQRLSQILGRNVVNNQPGEVFCAHVGAPYGIFRMVEYIGDTPGTSVFKARLFHPDFTSPLTILELMQQIVKRPVGYAAVPGNT